MNENAKIYICTHTDFDCPVHNPVYEILDARKLFPEDKDEQGVDALFYSELLSYRWLSDRPEMLPDIVGFCHYRKYWAFLDDVPNLQALVEQHGCIATTLHHVKGSVYNQYERCFNFADMDIAKAIVASRHHDLWDTFRTMLEGDSFYSCNMFLMRKQNFCDMMYVINDVLERYLAVVGLDLEQRILHHADIYLNKRSTKGKQIAHQYRMGGNIGERLASAWIMRYFPNPATYDIHITEKARAHKNL